MASVICMLIAIYLPQETEHAVIVLLGTLEVVIIHAYVRFVLSPPPPPSLSLSLSSLLSSIVLIYKYFSSVWRWFL